MGFLDDINPFKEGGFLGPQHPVGGQSPGTPVDPLTGERGQQHRDDFLYGGYEGGAQDFNAQTQAVAGGYGQQMQGVGNAYGGQLQNTGYQYGTGLDNMGHGQYGQGQALISQGADTLANADPNAYIDPNSLGQSNLAAANMSGQAQGMDVAAANLLNMNFDGPSAAEAQLNAGAQQAANQNLSLAASGRGMGGGAAARRAAMRQNAQIMGATNAQTAELRANEAATQRAQKMAATQAGGQMYGAAGNLYGQQAGIASQNLGTLAGAKEAAMSNASQLGLGLTNTGVGAMNQGAGTAQGAANTQLGAQQAAANTQLGALQGGANTELSGQQLQNQTNTGALAGTMGYEADMTGRRGQDLGAQAANQQNQQQNQAGMLNFTGSALSSLATMAASDRRAKTDVKRIPVDAKIFGGGDQQESQADTFAKQLSEFKASVGAKEGEPLEESASRRYLRHVASGEPMQWHNTQPRLTQQYQAPLTGINAGQAAGAAAARAGQNERASATPYGGPTEAEYQAAQPAGGSYGGVDVAALDDANRRARGNFGESTPSPEAAARTIDQANPYAFKYKDPARHGEGQRIGVMAQDLEKTPAGAAAVMRSPDGTRMVDTGELSTIAVAAQHNQQERQDDLATGLNDLYEKLGIKPPDLEGLDNTYAREASGWR